MTDPAGRDAQLAQPSWHSNFSLRRVAVLIGRVVATLLSLTIFVGSAYAWAGFRAVSSGLTTIQFGTSTTDSKQPRPQTPRADGKDQNILLVGDDSRAGASAAALAAIGTTADPGNNTDTIMLLHLPADGKRASLISFPRDALVDIPGYGQGKINSAYSDAAGAGNDIAAGARLLKTVISNLTGLQIDHFVKVSMFGFYDISKAIGGVDINLCAAQNKYTEGDADHPNGYSGINLPAGLSRNVQGIQALAFVRQRHGLTGGDYARIVRQEYFLSAAFDKVATAGTLLNPVKLSRFISAVSSSLVVDSGLQGQALIALASQMDSLTSGNLQSSTIPMLGADGVGDNYRGELIDTAALPTYIDRFVGRSTAYQKAKLLPPSQVSVSVVGSDQSPAGKAAVTTLTNLGFHTSRADGPAAAKTTITYSAGSEAQAKTLAAHLPGAVVKVVTGLHSVVLTFSPDAPVSSAPAAAETPVTAAAVTPAPFSDAAGASSAPAVHTANQAGCVN